MRIRNMSLLMIALAVMFLLACGSSESQEYYNQGIDFAESGDYRTAIDSFTKAIELDPDLAKAYLNRGTIYADLEQDEKAREDYSKAIQLNPDDARAYFNRGLSYGQLGQYEKALKDFDKAIELDPDYSEVINVRKRLLEALPDSESAAKAENFINRGEDLAASGDYKTAIVNFTNAIEIAPSYAGPYGARGSAYMSLNEYDLALDDFTQYIALAAPNDPRGYIGRALVYRDKEDWYKVFDNASRVIAMEGNNEAWLLDLSPQQIDKMYGAAYALRGTAYFSHLARAKENVPWTDSEALQMAAHLFKNIYVLGEADTPFIDIVKALDLDPSLDTAFNDLDKALDLDPSLEEIRETRLTMLEAYADFRFLHPHYRK